MVQNQDVMNFEVDLVNRYLSRLWVRSFSFLGMVIDTVIRLPGVYVVSNLVMDNWTHL